MALDPATQTANYSAQFVETSILKVRRGERRRAYVCVSKLPVYACVCACVRAYLLACVCRRTACNTRPPFRFKGGGTPQGVIFPPLTRVAVSGSMAVLDQVLLHRGLRKHTPFDR